MHYYVVTGGPLSAKAVTVIKGGKVIAADKGVDFCRRHEIVPCLAVGDMDSVSLAGLRYLEKSKIPTKTYPVEKDMTDTEIAISFVPRKDKITVVCPLNGRLDHVTANIQLAAALHAEGRDIKLDDGVTEVRFLKGPDQVTVKMDRYGDESAVSLVPLSFDKKVTGVTTEGLYYPLSNGTVECGKTLSFSNKPVSGANKVKVSINSGIMAVIVSHSEQ